MKVANSKKRLWAEALFRLPLCNAVPMRTFKLLAAAVIIGILVSEREAVADSALEDHALIAADLQDAAKVSALRSRLSGTWQIVVTDPAWTFQANIVGRALISVGGKCGLQMKWGGLQQADYYVWPVILSNPSADSVAEALRSLWTSAGQTMPVTGDEVAAAAYARLARSGIGRAVLTAQSGQQVNFVFMDGRQINSSNDVAAYHYSVASTVAGFDFLDGSPLDSDYSFALSGAGDLGSLAGTNDTRWQRLCRVMSLESAICGESVDSSSAAAVTALLATVDNLCAENGQVVDGLRKTEEEALKVMSANTNG